MPNVIASGTTVLNGTIKRNNFLIGVNTSISYGPTSATTFWNGIVPAASGYTIYAQKTVNGPSIRTAANDSELITIAKQYSGTNITTIYDALSYFNSQTNFMVTNIDYPNIVTSGLTLMVDSGYIPSYPTTGTSWNDLSGNNNNGTLVNSPTFDNGNGGSIFTNGVNQYITSPYFGNTTDSFTFAAWFKNDNYSEAKYALVRGRDASGNGWSLAITTLSDGRSYSGVVTTSGGATEFDAIGTSILPLNMWYYLTGVWTAGVSIRHYVNGVLEATTNTSSTNLRTSTDGWGIGSINTTNFTSGYNAIAQVYNRVLSASEIQQNYNAQKTRFGL